MQKANRRWLAGLGVVLILGFLATVPAMAQAPRGTLTGTVQDSDGAALPGVLVTVESPSLQGTRTTYSNANGDYKVPVLPAGDYTVRYELEGLTTVSKNIKISAVQTAISDVTMSVSPVAEEILVTSAGETISDTAEVASTFTNDEIEKLAIARTPQNAVSLTPGTAPSGPGGNTVISGAMSFENLYLINGVVVNENIRGQALDLFVEDAIQETTVSTAGVSAEYGRFTGGVVNVVTKSGGNRFDGSLRVNFDNEDWVSKTRFTADQEDKTNKTYELTFGGPIWKDRIWFFLSGRDRKTDSINQTTLTNIPFPQTREQQRYEGKLTVRLGDGHSLIGSYLEIDQVSGNSFFSSIDPLDLNVLVDREDPQDITAFNYAGLLTDNFLVEAQYSERNWEVANGSGGPRDLYAGSLFETTFDNSNWFAPFFCGSCEPEIRGNDNTLVKGSYFLEAGSAGTHDLTFGYDTFTDIRFSVNHQAGSDFRVATDDFFIDPATNEVYPVALGPSGSNWVAAWPVFGLDNVNKTDFVTNSFYINDEWQLNDHWSFNVGLRYDENDGRDAGGNLVTDDSKLSPRLSASWDVKGDGDLVVRASYGTYVAAIANGIADQASTGGAIGRAILFYGGDPINPDGDACLATNSCVTSRQAMEMMINWWLGATTVPGVPGLEDGFNPITDDAELIAQIPGVLFLISPGEETNQVIPDTIKSPSADDIVLGITKRIGTKGLFRADLVHREWEDFYSNRIRANNHTFIGGAEVDLTEIGNFGDNILERKYDGLHTQFRYNVSDRLQIAGTYTLSKLEGNIVGETSGSGPVTSSPNSHSEYKDPRWNTPVGDLSADQRHKLRAWVIYDILENDHHSLNVSWLQSFWSGNPYGSAGAVSAASTGVSNPGYVSVPGTFTYYFENRDTYTTDDITRSDVALNYSFRWNAFGTSMEVYIQPEILNLFDEDGASTVDTTIRDATNSSAFSPFNPFTDTPVQGTNWDKGPLFGQPDSEGDLQLPRTFRFSIGFRF